MSLAADLVQTFATTEALAVDRCTSSTVVDGIVVPVRTSLTIRAAVAPKKRRRNSTGGEGDRNVGEIEIFSTEALEPADVPGGESADIVTWRGRRWRVSSVDDWTESAGGYHSEAQVLDDGPEGAPVGGGI